MTRIAALGLGAMGTRICARLGPQGHELVVWNRTPQRAALVAHEHGWRAAPTPAKAVEGADVVLSVLRDDHASSQVWAGQDGALAAVTPGTLCLELSTLSPDRADAFFQEALSAGGRPVLAPMIGSRPQADAGTLVFLLGGTEPDRAAAATLLDPAAGSVRQIGSARDAASLKLVVNAALATQAALIAELRSYLHGAVDDAEAALEAVSEGAAFSPAARNLSGRMRAGAFTPNFPIDLVGKDLGYLLGSALAQGSDTRLISRVHEIFAAVPTEVAASTDIAGIAGPPPESSSRPDGEQHPSRPQ